MDPDVTKPRPASLIAGEFELGRKLGSGGFGSVFEARHRSTGLPYAVKRIELSHDDAERFRKEALYPARIANQSLHVLSIHSFFGDQDEGYFYLVTELIPHGDLRRFMDTQERPLPLAQALDIAAGIAKGLAAIHEQRIVHRDLKPGNILMDRKDGRWVPKIADFGLARSSDSVSLGEFASSGYAAPEQVDLAAEPRLGPESDLFSFGMVLYELLTGERATPAKELRDYVRWISERRPPPAPSSRRTELSHVPELDSLIARLLEFDPDKRTIGAGEAATTLAEAARMLPGLSASEPATRVQPPVPGRSPDLPATSTPASVAERPVAPVSGAGAPRIQRGGAQRKRLLAGVCVLAVAALAGVVWFGGSDAADASARDALADYRAARYARALPALLDAAEGGDADARAALGRMYANGWGVERNASEAKRWLDLAAREDNADARCALGDMYRDGAGVEQRADEALRQYGAAADRDDVCGQKGLGYLHLNGLGVPANYDEGLRWYELAAGQGDAEAQATLTKLQAGWALGPLFTGPWRSLEGSERRDEVERLRKAGVLERIESSDPRRMRRIDVEFYEDASVFELEVGRADGGLGILTYIRSGDELIMIDGKAPQIHDLSARAPVRIDTLPRAVAFLRFFMGAIQGDDGIFRLIDGIDDLHWLAGAAEAQREAARLSVQRLEVEPSPSGGWRGRSTIEYGDALYRADLWLKPNGMVEMSDDRRVADGLSIAVERFDEKGVRVRVEPATRSS